MKYGIAARSVAAAAAIAWVSGAAQAGQVVIFTDTDGYDVAFGGPLGGSSFFGSVNPSDVQVTLENGVRVYTFDRNVRIENDDIIVQGSKRLIIRSTQNMTLDNVTIDASNGKAGGGAGGVGGAGGTGGSGGAGGQGGDAGPTVIGFLGGSAESGGRGRDGGDGGVSEFGGAGGLGAGDVTGNRGFGGGGHTFGTSVPVNSGGRGGAGGDHGSGFESGDDGGNGDNGADGDDGSAGFNGRDAKGINANNRSLIAGSGGGGGGGGAGGAGGSGGGGGGAGGNGDAVVSENRGGDGADGGDGSDGGDGGDGGRGAAGGGAVGLEAAGRLTVRNSSANASSSGPLAGSAGEAGKFNGSGGGTGAKAASVAFPGGDGGDSGAGGFGGAGGAGGDGGFGAGGTVRLTGSIVSFDGASADVSTPTDADGKVVVERNAGSLAGLTIDGPSSAITFSGPTAENRHLSGGGETPILPDLVGGVGASGVLANFNASSAAFGGALDGAASDDWAALTRLDDSSAIFGVDFVDFDLVLLTNLTNDVLLNGKLGASVIEDGFSATLRPGTDWKTGAIYALLVPEEIDFFSASFQSGGEAPKPFSFLLPDMLLGDGETLFLGKTLLGPPAGGGTGSGGGGSGGLPGDNPTGGATTIPVPAPIFLLATGLIGLLAAARRRRA